VATAFDTSMRTLTRWSVERPPILAPTAYGRRMGRTALMEYALTLLGARAAVYPPDSAHLSLRFESLAAGLKESNRLYFTLVMSGPAIRRESSIRWPSAVSTRVVAHSPPIGLPFTGSTD